MIDANKFKIRCSAIGKIMAYPAKNEVPKGAITYLEQWAKEQIYSRTKEFTSKYTDKGHSVEGDAIDYVSKHYGWGMIAKNQKFYENEYMQGTPDLVLNDFVGDIKAPYDAFTFPLFDSKIPESDYDWQLQGYMELTEK